VAREREERDTEAADGERRYTDAPHRPHRVSLQAAAAREAGGSEGRRTGEAAAAGQRRRRGSPGRNTPPCRTEEHRLRGDAAAVSRAGR
jgi:hypothetical protein